MKTTITSFLTLLTFMMVSVTLSAQYQATSTTVSTTPGTSLTQTFNVVGYPASGPGSLTVFLKGDFNGGASTNESIDVSDESSTLLAQVTTSVQCGTTFESTIIPLTQAQINGWGAGDNLISFTFQIGSGSGFCATEEFYVQLSYPTAYCSSLASNNGDSDIEQVVFNTINQSSVGNCTGYSNYTGVSTTLNIGGSYNLSITTSDCDGGNTYSQQTRAYIDWNNDGDFTDNGELVFTKTFGTAGTTIQSVTVPNTATTGTTTMRIVTTENNANIYPCGTYNYGETEDYTITLVNSCASGASNGGDTDIENVTINTINQSSIGNCVGYTDYTAVSTTLNIGTSYTLSVTTSDCDGGSTFNRQTRAYIDWNDDGDYYDAGELVLTRAMGAPTTTAQSFTVPSGATLGQIGLRIVTTESATINPCGVFSYGETEDYSLIISPSSSFCTTTISTFPYNEDFESFTLCSVAPGASCALANGWTNESGDDIDWTTFRGATTSPGTGPTTDYNPGTTTGHYLYLEASVSGTGFPNKQAIVTSPCFDLTGKTYSYVQFAYNMSGATMGSLTLEVSTGGSWTSIWTQSGNQGTAWHTANVNLVAYNGQTIKLRFNGITGSGFESDIAIDDINVVAQSFCISTVSSFPYTEDFESFASCSTTSGSSCTLSNGWVNETGDNLDWTTDQGGTTSSATGPTIDYNPGTTSGNYLYIESSDNTVGYPNMTAIVTSPCYDLTGMSSSQIQFAYSMYGNTMGSLALEISTGGNWITIWNLTGNQGTAWNTATVDISSYDGQTVKIRFKGITGSSYESDMAIDDIHITSGCTSTVVNLNYSGCNSVTVHGVTYNSSQLVSDTVVVNGCDSITNYNITVNSPSTTSATISGCGSVIYSGTTYYSSQAITNTMSGGAANGCDSIHITNIVVHPTLTSTLNQTVCFGGSIVVHGTTYNASHLTGTETFTNAGPNGCDSVVTVTLSILPQLSSTHNETICYGGSIVLNGTTYNASNLTGTETFTNVGPYNCDSVVTVNITILAPLTGTYNGVICTGGSLLINGTTYNASNLSGTEVYPNIGPYGCDSIVLVNITVLPQLSSTLNDTVCNGGSIVVNGTTYNASNLTGTETFINVGSNNCDSVVTVNLTVLPTLTSVYTPTVCNGGSIVVNGTTYDATNLIGTEIFTNVGQHGCDSIVTVSLTVLPQLTSTHTETVCYGGSIVINGTTYNASNLTGTETFTNVGPYNCDSVVTVSLTVLAPLSGTYTETLCANESVNVNGTTYNASNPTGTEVFTNVGLYGCDSIVTVSLNFLPQLTGTYTETVCFGGSIVVNGTTYDANNLSGTEVFSNVGPSNCDSTVTVTLTILPQVDSTTSTAGVTITSNETSATYQWIDCNNGNSPIVGETNASFTATVNGDYAVEVTVGTCTVTSACVNINSVGINEHTFGTEVKLYPNPTNDKITVDLGKIKGATLSIVTVTGKEIYHLNKTTRAKTEISLAEFSKGVYFVVIKSNNQQKVVKLIKQ